MTESLYLLGAPGVGKSTVLAAILDQVSLRVDPTYDVMLGKLRGHRLVDPMTDWDRGWYLGRSRPEFPGTDGLSMAVAPDAREWARRLPEQVASRHLYVVGEGARLGNVGFLSALAETSLLTVALLTADQDALTARREGRGSTQTPSWMRGAETGARNAYEGVVGAHRRIHIDTTDLTPEQVANSIVGATA